MKKILALVITVFTVFAFVGCANATDDGKDLIIDIVNNLTSVEQDFEFSSEVFEGSSISGTGRMVTVSVEDGEYLILAMYPSKDKLALLTIYFEKKGTLVQINGIAIVYTDLKDKNYMDIYYNSEDVGYTLEDMTYKQFIKVLERMSVKTFELVRYELAD